MTVAAVMSPVGTDWLRSVLFERGYLARIKGEAIKVYLVMVEACADDDGGSDCSLVLGWDEGAHEVEHVGGEEGVEGAVVDAHRRAFADLDLGEAGPFEFCDEVTLRQGAGHSPGPGGGMAEDLRRELLVGDGEVGDGELAAGP